MWIIFAYRKISYSYHKNYVSALFNHLLFLKNHFEIIFPEEVSSKKLLQISLCFDYASADFYYSIFPFLEKNNIKAVLGVPCRYVTEKAPCDVEKRLIIPDGLATLDSVFYEKQPFCSWEEIISMKNSRLIHFASHGFAIRNLKKNPLYLRKEIESSKEILEAKLEISIDNFIYPLGLTDAVASDLVKENYRYSFLLGNAVNFNKQKHSLYRIDASDSFVLDHSLKLRSFIKYIKNTSWNRIKAYLS